MKLSDIVSEQKLTESSLSRVHQHLQSDRPIGIISAFRPSDEATERENIANNRSLASDARSAGFGYIWVDGAWIDDETGEHLSEVSLMIFGNEDDQEKLFRFLVDKAQQFNQDAFVMKEAGGTGVSLFDKSGKSLHSFDNASLDKISDFYTKLRGGNHSGRSFVFEGAYGEKNRASLLADKYKYK